MQTPRVCYADKSNSLSGLFPASSLQPPALRGFTLIELMVVLAIVVIVSLLILISASRFNSSILLRSLAYEVGLAIREAQLYGVAVKGTARPTNCSVGITGQFCAPYGVDFQKNSSQIIVFADTDTPQPDGVYQSGSEPRVDAFQAQYGFTISNICAGDGQSAYYCANGDVNESLAGGLTGTYGNSLTLQALDITFKRPNPNAIITVTSSTGAVSGPYAQALVVVSSPSGSSRSILISLTGQIVITGTGS